MGQMINMKSALDFQSAFQVEPEIGKEASLPGSVGVYRWSTSSMDGFELPECDDLVIAMHLGGSRQVRALTDHGPSRSRSAPGLLTILPAGQPAAFRTHGSVRLVSLHISRAAFAVDPLQSPRFAFQDPFAGAAMDALLHAACDGQLPKADYIARISGALLYHLAYFNGASPAAGSRDHGPNRPQESGPLARIGEYVDANLGGRLDLDELARHCGLSRATLVRRFRQASGLSPHQYVTAKRIEAAKTLLQDSDHDLSFIAQEVGFANQSHFTSIFRSTTGITPGQFRQRH